MVKAEEVKAEDEMSPLEKKIIRQIEYYFGDFNLPRDKFLQAETKTDDGWVTMETMLKFKRLTELSSDAAIIVSALGKSKAQLMEVADDGSKIRRSPDIPLPENTEDSRKALEARTAYAKGFDKEGTTLDELIDFFNENNPNVVSVQMRNWADGKGKEKVYKFKGSIFLTFKTREAATEFVEATEFKYKTSPLIRKWQKDYLAEKAEEIAARKKKGNKPQGGLAAARATESTMSHPEEEEFKLPTGATLKLTGLGGEATREDIKEVMKEKFKVNIEKDGDIAFITYEKGEEEAKVRFREEDAAKPVGSLWGDAGEVEVKGNMVTCTVLEGEEETQFLADSVQQLKERRNKQKATKRMHSFRGGRGGRGGKRGRFN